MKIKEKINIFVLNWFQNEVMYKIKKGNDFIEKLI